MNTINKIDLIAKLKPYKQKAEDNHFQHTWNIYHAKCSLPVHKAHLNKFQTLKSYTLAYSLARMQLKLGAKGQTVKEKDLFVYNEMTDF